MDEMRRLIIDWAYNTRECDYMASRLNKYGDARVRYLNSILPQLFWGEPQEGHETEKENSNHAVIELDGKKIVDVFKVKRDQVTRGRFFDENVPVDAREEVEQILASVRYYTPRMNARNRPLAKWGMLLTLLLLLLNMVIIPYLLFSNRLSLESAGLDESNAILGIAVAIGLGISTVALALFFRMKFIE